MREKLVGQIAVFMRAIEILNAAGLRRKLIQLFGKRSLIEQQIAHFLTASDGRLKALKTTLQHSIFTAKTCLLQIFVFAPHLL